LQQRLLYTRAKNPPTVDLTYEGSGTCGSSYKLKWTTNNATSCTASGGWSGSKTTSGSEYVGSFNGTKTFTLTCWGSGGTASDSVTLTGNSDDNLEVDAGPDQEIDANETAKLKGSINGNYDNLEWECNDGDLSNRNTLRPIFEPPSRNYNYDKIYTCTLTASNECSQDSDTVKIRVNASKIMILMLI